MIKVLVLDAAQRSALAVTRSLGRMPDVQVFTAEAAGQALAGQSKFSKAFYTCPSAQHAPADFVCWVQKLMTEEQFDLVVPVTEITSQLLLMQQAQLPQVVLPFASYEQVLRLADKGQLVDLARDLGVPVPQSRWFAHAQGLDIHALQYPLVLKPCLSKIFVNNTWLATRVRVLASAEEFAQELVISPYLQEHAFMLQAFIPGHGAGIFALYNRGVPLAFFAHERLREKPPEGGVSVLSVSVPVAPLLETYARQLLDASHWHGVAMIEFRVAPDGTYYLMEVNTRFWGSLQLAIDAGVDFPKLLLQAQLQQPVAPIIFRPANYLTAAKFP